MSRGVMLFDADCGFCTRCAAYVAKHAFDVEVRSLQSVDLLGCGVSPERAERELPFVAADGRVNYGHEAVAQVLRAARNPVVGLTGRALTLPLIRLVARVGYTRVAAHRHQLPGGTAACALPGASVNPSD